MHNMPSLASLTSNISFGSSLEEPTPSIIASPSYENDMIRSHSLHSCFSTSSFSTAASSVASTSQSVMERKHPLAQNKIAQSQVIKLRSTQSRRAIKSDDGMRRVEVTRTRSQESFISQRASIHMSSPLSDDLDCMIFEPMQQLPSPTIYTTELAGFIQDRELDGCTCLAQGDEVLEDATRKQLLDLWSAAEDTERHRKLQKQRPRKHQPVSSGEANAENASSQRMRTWVTRMKRTASTTHLGMTAKRDLELNEISDPVAWASQERLSTPVEEKALETCFEPRQPQTAEAYLDQLLCERSESHQTCERQRRSQPVAASGCIWDFLG